MAKKKVAESSSSSSSSSSIASSHSAKKQCKKKEEDSAKTFAEKVRDHKELESRWGVLQEARVEYFRGKDFVSFLKSHPELKTTLGVELSSVHEKEEDVGNLLLKRKLILRCDRVVKTLRPGRKKLSKWPARLELFPEQTFSVEDAFYAWTFEKRRPLWQTILSFLVPIITLACCLFPVFPQWCKLVVLYLCLALLALIFSILFLRWVVFGLLWILLGKRVWFFPNILAEDASFSELFRFWPEPSKDDEKPPRWTARAAVALATLAIVYFCIHHAPDEAARARYQRRVSNIIDDVLEWNPRLALSGKQSKTVTLNETVKNETEAGNGVPEEGIGQSHSKQNEDVDQSHSKQNEDASTNQDLGNTQEDVPVDLESEI